MVSKVPNIAVQGYKQSNLYQNGNDAAVSSPIITGNLQQPQYDSVNFTSNASAKKEKSTPWGAILLGAAAIGAGVFLTKGKLWGKELQARQNLSKIFGKDFSKDEAKTLLQKYKEIYKIDDKHTFIDELFKQVKKDYGYEGKDITWHILNKPVETSSNELKGAAKYSFSLGEVGVLPTRSKDEIFISMTHEFDHVRQEEYMYRTSPEKTRKSCVEKTMDYLKTSENHKNDFELIQKDAEEFADEQMKRISKRWGDREAFSVDSKQYKLGEKYLESNSKYVNNDKKLYDNDFNEKEAHKIGDLMRYVVENHLK